MHRVRTQFIAANVDTHSSDAKTSKGTGADTWGLWVVDPGPRGVPVAELKQLEASGGKAPAGWQLDNSDLWVEENGLLMETPQPLPPGKYRVTGGRELTTELSVGRDGSWKLAQGTLYDITHLPCRTGRYVPSAEGLAAIEQFKVAPGGKMPDVPGYSKRTYSVVFVEAVDDEAMGGQRGGR